LLSIALRWILANISLYPEIRSLATDRFS
jgi:hypothetical protein